ncbi:carbonic anhydrase/acetyltransferase-like protein (isoleucine patch superfamily) [Rhodoligotrophos appendicifer]|uniref:gamma carbonic anhydrase family protein n=1 Tax=Rhodoligotrophos appendicifer TaxID=987056 RepID=UPI001186A505|nr:gamma carbonic anhydrase family protein [Rhodoligotrophos appendicifer]
MTIYSLDDFHPHLPDPGTFWVAESASVIGHVRLDRNVSVWFGAVLRGDNDLMHIGEGSNVQDNSVLHSDAGCPLTVGRHCTIGHKAILHGCTIGDNSLIGMNATVMNRAVIGRNCLIGAHALIPEGKVIPDNSMVLGMPGKVVRELTPAEQEDLVRSAEHYVANWKRFRNGLQVVAGPSGVSAILASTWL